MWSKEEIEGQKGLKKKTTHIIIRRANISGGMQARASAEDSINITADSTHL